MPGFELLRRSFEDVPFFVPGEPTRPLPTRAGPAGILVCNEAMLPEVAGARARRQRTAPSSRKTPTRAPSMSRFPDSAGPTNRSPTHRFS